METPTFKTDGNGDMFLADDGTYKYISTWRNYFNTARFIGDGFRTTFSGEDHAVVPVSLTKDSLVFMGETTSLNLIIAGYDIDELNNTITFDSAPRAGSRIVVQIGNYDSAYTGEVTAISTRAAPYIHVMTQNIDVFFEKYPIIDRPASTAYDTAISPDGIHMAVSHEGSPYLSIYRKVSTGEYSRLPDPLSEIPIGVSTGVAFSPDNQYMAVATWSYPYLYIYKRFSDFFQRIPLGDLPTGKVNDVCFDMDSALLAVGHNEAPRLTVYSVDNATDTLEKLSASNFDGLSIPSAVYSVQFSPDNLHLAVGYSSAPFIQMFGVDGQNFTDEGSVDTPPTGTVNGVGFGPKSAFMVLAHNISPYVSIYKNYDGQWGKVQDPETLPTGNSTGVSVSKDGAFVNVSHENEPYFTAYRRLYYNFIKLDDPKTLPYGNASDIFTYPSTHYGDE